MSNYLPAGTEYLGSLNSWLRDLRGYGTLVNELVQNADDAPNATEIVFDICDNALIIQNNGQFSDCGNQTARECPWRDDLTKGHRCDFHRFRKTAGADKRRQENTTGAFGIGFIAVYQITDHPELRSGKRHWILHPEESEARRVYVQEPTRHFEGTQFRLPWAMEDSEVRQALGVAPLKPESIDLMAQEIERAIGSAILFLRKLERIELRRNGRLVRVIQRQVTENQVIITDGNETIEWYLFHGSFQEEAKRLRERTSGQIELKRSPEVTIALPKSDSDIQGFFHVFLPTKHAIGLPFHINADFYPSSDRKMIQLEQDDYQGDWNKKAIQASAKVLATVMPSLSKLLGPTRFWNLLGQLKAIGRAANKGRQEAALASFWRQAKPQLQTHPSIYTSVGTWSVPKGTFLLKKKDEEAPNLPVLEAMSLPVVHPTLNKHYNILLELGVTDLTATTLARHLKKEGLTDPCPLADAPQWMQNQTQRELLANEIAILLKRGKNKTLFNRCAIAETIDGWLAWPSTLRQTERETLAVFAMFSPNRYFLAKNNPAPIQELVAEFSLDDALSLLEQASKTLATHTSQKTTKKQRNTSNLLGKVWTNLWGKKEEPQKPTPPPQETTHQTLTWTNHSSEIMKVIRWLQTHHAITIRTASTYQRRLRNLPIWPSQGELHTLDNLVIPAEFSQPLQLPGIVDMALLGHQREFLRNDLNVPELSVTYLSTLFHNAELNKIMPLISAPAWFQSKKTRHLLGREIEQLCVKHGTGTIKQALQGCAIAFSTEGGLVPLDQLRQAKSNTISLFHRFEKPCHFLDEINSNKGMCNLVDQFEVQDALSILEKTPVTVFQQRWQTDRKNHLNLIGWFDSHKVELITIDQGKTRLKNLQLWPSGEQLYVLDRLVVPGNFEDPLQLTTLVEADLLHHYRYFLTDILQAKQLTILTYVSDFIPQAFQSIQGVSKVARQKLVKLLSYHLAKFRHDNEIKKGLQACSLIEGNNGLFYKPTQLYFDIPYIRDVLGDVVPLAVIPTEESGAITDLFKWLEVADAPRPNDVIKRIKQLTQRSKPLVGRRRDMIQRLFSQIAEQWEALNKVEQQAFRPLKEWPWLPAIDNFETWHTSTTLYTLEKRHLFETQANFLDIVDQKRYQSFIEFLEVKQEPTATQIVEHLLVSAKANLPIHTELYRVLSHEHLNDSAIKRLKGTACFAIQQQDGLVYKQANQIFWEKHPFGSYRDQLHPSWQAVSPLLNKLGVKARPEADDVIAVMLEIAAKHGQGNQPINQQTEHVVIQCWKELNKYLDQGVIKANMLRQQLQEQPVIPNNRYLLTAPDALFFEDRPGLKEKFNLLKDKIILRTIKVWQAMEAAGVRQLSEAMTIELVDCVRPQRSVAVEERLRDPARQLLIARITEAYQETDPRNWNLPLLPHIRVLQAETLEVTYTIHLLNQHEKTPTESRVVYYDAEEAVLYYQPLFNNLIPWASLARELAYALNPKVEISHVASNIKEVLSADSVIEANRVLDELGFPPLADLRELEVSTNSNQAEMGGLNEIPAYIPPTPSMMEPYNDETYVVQEDDPEIEFVDVSDQPDRLDKLMQGPNQGQVTSKPKQVLMIDTVKNFGGQMPLFMANNLKIIGNRAKSNPSPLTTTTPPQQNFKTSNVYKPPLRARNKTAKQNSQVFLQFIGSVMTVLALCILPMMISNPQSGPAPAPTTKATLTPRSKAVQSSNKPEISQLKLTESYSGAEDVEGWYIAGQTEKEQSTTLLLTPKRNNCNQRYNCFHLTDVMLGDGTTLEDEAIDQVLAFEREAGRNPREIKSTAMGYDIRSKGSNGVVRYIEVKVVEEYWGKAGIRLTAEQLNTALEQGDNYWLYIIQQTNNHNPELIHIQNPAYQTIEIFDNLEWYSLVE